MRIKCCVLLQVNEMPLLYNGFEGGIKIALNEADNILYELSLEHRHESAKLPMLFSGAWKSGCQWTTLLLL